MKVRLIAICVLLFVPSSFGQGVRRAQGFVPFGQGVRPAQGFVAEAGTAIKIAEAVLVPVYGKGKIESERPFIAHLEDAIWTVHGSLHCFDSKGVQTTGICLGGVATVEISKTDGRIISMSHGEREEM